MILVHTGKTLNAESLFLAMCALLSVTSSAKAGVSYWTYISLIHLYLSRSFGEMWMHLYLPSHPVPSLGQFDTP